MQTKYLILISLGVILAGTAYYYRDDLGNLVYYGNNKDKAIIISDKKISNKPAKINIKNLDEL
mgnify:CR=1 FL=1